MEKLSRAQPLFVRCIKPNRRQTHRDFDSVYVTEQLNYNGLLELAKIRRIGFPVRLHMLEFAERSVNLIRCLKRALTEICPGAWLYKILLYTKS